jgi:inhibitor of KinA sporulation pathway (predicted exonuclease)
MVNFPTQKEYIAVIDFEATCCNDKSIPRNKTEIIEFACIVVDRDINEIARFNQFVKPYLYPKLTEFCTNLTSITQDQVDDSKGLGATIHDFTIFLSKNNVEKALFASWGYYDRNQLKLECRRNNLIYPFTEEHLNLKVWTAESLGLKKAKSVGGILQYLKMEFVGTPHRGIDDVENIIRVIEKVFLKI